MTPRRPIASKQSRRGRWRSPAAWCTVLSLGVVGSLVVAACGGPSPDDRQGFQAPPRAGFEPVADVLGKRCGTLDCHGQVGRNLRVYGHDGLRLDPGLVSGGQSTTDAEYTATYQSVIAVGAADLERVVLGDTSWLEHWIVLAKGRGEYAHKGHDAMPRGTPGDQCLVAWATGRLAADPAAQQACATSAALESPFPP